MRWNKIVGLPLLAIIFSLPFVLMATESDTEDKYISALRNELQQEGDSPNQIETIIKLTESQRYSERKSKADDQWRSAFIALISSVIGTIAGAILGFFLPKMEGPKIEVYAGDSIDLVKLNNNKISRVHVSCTFANSARKAGIVTKVAAILTTPQTKKIIFQWRLFYKYEQGHIAVPDSKVCPISVPANQSVFQGIEFETKDDVDWEAGEYKVKVFAWVEKDEITAIPSIKDEFSIVLTNAFVADLISKKVQSAELNTVMIRGREISTENLRNID